MSLAASLFLFRKTLPADSPSLDAYHDKFVNEKPINGGFCDFVDQEIPRLFKEGWDKGFHDRVKRVIVGRKSCLEKGNGIETSRDFSLIIVKVSCRCALRVLRSLTCVVLLLLSSPARRV